MQEGRGWRLAVDPSRSPFPVLIGGEGWGVELRAPEAEALRCGVERLLAQFRAVEEMLMAEEAIELELELALEAGSLWLALEGDRRAWGLRFVLTPGPGQRGVEGGWSTAAAPAFVAALALASPFSDRPA